MPQEYKHDLPNPTSFNYRGLLLYILPAPLVVKLLFSIIALSPLKIALTGGALFFFYSAAHLTRTTLIRLAENKQHHKPKKIRDYRYLSMIYVGFGMVLLMFLIRRPIFPALIIMTTCAMAGYYLTYGLRSPKSAESIDFDAMPKATREAIKDAYEDINHIEALTKQLSPSDKPIAENIDKVITQSYGILDLLSHSPNDAGRARRFLNVYINRIKEILEQYISLAKYDKADSYSERLNTVLEETHRVFSAQQSKLLDDDQFRLDVQLEVLDEQIKNENK